MRYIKQAAKQTRQDNQQLVDRVRDMIGRIEKDRDEAVRAFAKQLDGWDKAEFRVSNDEIADAKKSLSETFKDDFAFCKKQVTNFAKRQRESIGEFEDEFGEGIILGQKVIPVENVGCYIPGGKYPLISAAIMSVATAKVAGVPYVVGAAPPREGRGIFPPTLYALAESGADEIYAIGGVQAFASMAFGCVGMKPVDMITGPGNAFVAEAKRQLFGQVGIDLPAGPTEILVIADASADPALVATDLLGQAEHGPDSPAWLISTSEQLAMQVIAEVERQLTTLPTREVAGAAWTRWGEVVVVDSDDEAIAVSDAYAPEHLEVLTANNDYYLKHLRNYGSLFVGEESTVAYGDKGVGTNHTLPTGRAARYTGGLWVGKFLKTVTYQRLTAEASQRIAPIIGRMCASEGMLAHEITATVREQRYAQRRRD
ncbi:sulfopropanediol 3-dehydrogenase [Variibacter gotjawalensis]|uniref:Sulfopropanediol 3-dehydrogenase n=1 Tax=Variibacter gotjawalensis TaxID=1333996 RepID=A0A0S3PU24_9BRAD|nr:histidinol dehydrogenase [Variibacter gotjawalensis]NIK49754.1 sulfopropanediol 3-dehydrogenase [Variibacter gotjawalensis]RZS45759.1 sulfopropanediol 3-dehydrogenase [Variibacter gotjawalensis]BAT59432.1 sulfopropanediol 3-dehydrogenase [Variibacter gotjawalensis]